MGAPEQAPERYRETERKYELALDAALPRLRGVDDVAGETKPVRHRLDATYFDTAAFRLVKAGITLRRRTGGDDAGWHLKMPAGGSARDEYRLPLSPPRNRPPQEFAALLRARTLGNALTEVARITTRRTERRLLDDTGAVLAIVADDATTATVLDHDAHRSTTWREVEIELGEAGTADTLAALDTAIRAAGATPGTAPSKLRRALGDAVPDEPVAPPRPARATAGDVAVAYLSTHLARLVDEDFRVRQDDPDSVHQMRVACRRLRSALRVFDRVIDSAAIRPVRRDLAWLGAVLGAERDREVLLARLESEAHALPDELVVGPVIAQIGEHFTAQRRQTRKAVLGALNGSRYLNMLRALDHLAHDPPLTVRATGRPRRVLRSPVRREARRLVASGRLARSPVDDIDELLHQVRKDAKRARYATEAVGDVFGSRAARWLRQVRRLQTVLGEHQDSVVARTALTDLAARARDVGEDTFPYGVLYQREVETGAASARMFRRYWRRVERVRRRWPFTIR